MTTAIRLIAERSIIYAPHHVADMLGFFDDEGLEIRTDYNSGPGGSWLSDILVDGHADIARGGVWLPMLYRRSIGDLRLFGLLCDRNPQALMSRRAGTFTPADLAGTTVLLPTAATSQWMFFWGVLREHGVDLDRIRFVRDLEVSTMARLWRSGFGDYLLAGPPLSQELVDEGHPVAATLAELGGRVPWSVYYTTRRMTEQHEDRLAGFMRAILRAQRWMADHPAAESADLVAGDFPEIDREVLSRALARMLADGIWIPRAEVPEIPLTRYQGIIRDYGLIDQPFAYEQIVSARPAARAEAFPDDKERAL